MCVNCALLLVLAHTDNYVKLAMSNIQALTARSAEDHLFRL